MCEGPGIYPESAGAQGLELRGLGLDSAQGMGNSSWKTLCPMTTLASNMCEIRSMTGADIEACSSLSVAARKDSWESLEKSFYPRDKFEEELLLYSPESLEKFTDTPGLFSFVAVEGKEVRGCVLGKIDADGGIGDIGWLFVVKDMRGRGIAGRLIEAASKRASDSGCHKIIAFTMKALPEANKMYRRYGFDMEGDFPRHWMKIDFVQYGKQL